MGENSHTAPGPKTHSRAKKMEKSFISSGSFVGLATLFEEISKNVDFTV